jgi:hypothetical protein
VALGMSGALLGAASAAAVSQSQAAKHHTVTGFCNTNRSQPGTYYCTGFSDLDPKLHGDRATGAAAMTAQICGVPTYTHPTNPILKLDPPIAPDGLRYSYGRGIIFKINPGYQVPPDPWGGGICFPMRNLP